MATPLVQTNAIKRRSRPCRLSRRKFGPDTGVPRHALVDHRPNPPLNLCPPAWLQHHPECDNVCVEDEGEDKMLSILWTIIIGFIAGVIAKWIHSGPNEPSGFVMTALLGIVGAFVATYLGQLVGWYGPNDGAGFIASIVGAVIVLAIWGMIARRRTTASL